MTVTSELSPTLDDINTTGDLCDPLAGIVAEAGWIAVGDGFVARDGKRPISVKGGLVRAGYKAAAAASYAAATQTARGLSSDGAGVGVVLGDRGDGYCLASWDLDAVRDRNTGHATPWAHQICELFATYVEISLSGTGLHALFWITADALLVVREIIARQKPTGASLDCAVWRAPDGIAKAELYLANRFIALTGWRLSGFPEAPQTIDPELFR